jgi:hypothetical protein
LKAQELNPDQQVAVGSLKVEPDAGGPEDWKAYNNGGSLFM